MSCPGFFLDTLSAGSLTLPESEARHARLSRRLSVDDRVMLFDGQGHEACGRVVVIEKHQVNVELDNPVFRPRPLPALTLAVALPKGTRQDTLIEKCTELGVAEIQPLITDRSVASASTHKLEKRRRASIEAAKQSGQCWLPRFANRL